MQTIHPLVEKGTSERFYIGLIYKPADVIAGNPIVDASASVLPVEVGGLELVGDPVIEDNQVTQMIDGGNEGIDYTVQFVVTLQDTSVYASPSYEAIVVKVIGE